MRKKDLWDEIFPPSFMVVIGWNDPCRGPSASPSLRLASQSLCISKENSVTLKKLHSAWKTGPWCIRSRETVASDRPTELHYIKYESI